MANLEITINTSQAFSAIAAKIANADPLYKAWANYLESEVVEAFKNETSPAGIPWQALSPATQAIKKAKGSIQKILKDTGGLYDSIAATILPDGVFVGTNKSAGAYSLGALHQYGTKKMVARPFLPMDSSGNVLPFVVEDLQGIANDYFTS